MKKVQLSCTAVALLAASHAYGHEGSDHSVDPFAGCDEQPYVILYQNGIWKNFEKSQESMFEVRAEIEGAAPNYNVNLACIYVDFIHNETGITENGLIHLDGPAFDFYQAYLQWSDQNISIDIYDWMAKGFPGYSSQIEAKSLMVDIIISAVEDGFELDEEIGKAVTVYDHWVNGHGAKIIPLSHSQGNYHANEAEEQFESMGYPDDTVQIVAVATPAAHVGYSGSDDRYTTNDGDIINLVPFGLDASGEEPKDCENIVSSFVTLKSFGCHSFVGTYLTESVTLNSILNNIFDIIKPVHAGPRRLTNFDYSGARILDVVESYGDLYIAAQANSGGHFELHRSGGVDSPPIVVANTYGNGDDRVFKLETVGQRFYFLANDDFGRRQLWHSRNILGFDVTSVYIDRFPLNYPSWVHSLAVTGDVIALSATDRDYPNPYFSTSLAAQGSKRLKVVRAQEGHDLYNPEGFVAIDDQVFFFAQDTIVTTIGKKVWVAPMFDLLFSIPAREIPSNAYLDKPQVAPHHGVKFLGEFCFATSETLETNSSPVFQLWCTDGISPAYKRADLGDLGTGLRQIKAVGNRLYFRYGDLNNLKSYDSLTETITDYDVGMFRYISDLVSDGENLYVSSGSNPSRLYSFDAFGNISFLYESPQGANAYVHTIKHLTEHKGDLYFADTTIRKVLTSGVEETITIPATLINIYGISGIFSRSSGIYATISTVEFGTELWQID